MLIVDSQVHIWAASTPARPWPARHAPHRPEPFCADDLLQHRGRDRCGRLPSPAFAHIDALVKIAASPNVAV